MLTTFRLPIVDGRRFAADPQIANSVVLPSSWDTGDFVRGFGKVSRRPLGAVEPWSFEGTYADLHNTLTFSGSGIQAFNREFQDNQIQAVRKRAWMALPKSEALLDVDVALQQGPRGHRHPYSDPSEFALKGVVETISAAALLPVRVRGESPDSMIPLRQAGKSLSSRFSTQTANRQAPGKPELVKAMHPCVVVEAPGRSGSLDRSIRAQQLRIGNIRLASFDADTGSTRSIRCHVLWDTTGSKADRKRIRQLRIHILRLHSVYEFLRFLASSRISGPNSPISSTTGEPGFDALQQALLSCARLAESANTPAGGDVDSLLNVAFSGRNFSDRKLPDMLDRALTGMRPKVRNELEDFLSSEKRRASRNSNINLGRGNHSASHIIFKDGVNNVYIGGRSIVSKFNIKGDNFGAIGDGSSINNSVIGDTSKLIKIGNENLPSETLQQELLQLRAQVLETSRLDKEEIAQVLESAEESARIGDGENVRRRLRGVGTWVFETASSIGKSVAAAAIAVAIGIP